MQKLPAKAIVPLLLKVIKKVIIVMLVLVGLLFLFKNLDVDALGLTWACFILLFFYSYGALVYQFSFRYKFEKETLYTTKGFLSKVSQEVPSAKIQEVKLIQSASEQLLGLATLVVSTGGAQRIFLSCLPLSEANSIKDKMLKK